MNGYRIAVTKTVHEGIERHKRAGNHSLLMKIKRLLLELCDTPRSGSGRPERLKYQSGEVWSRRIDSKHMRIKV